MTASPPDAPSAPLFLTGGAWTDWCCGKRVPGGRAEHCPVCHESFSTDRIGDKHRAGPYDGERLCITRFEMTAKRWRLIDRGGAEVWVGRAPTETALAALARMPRPAVREPASSHVQALAGTSRPNRVSDVSQRGFSA